MKFKNLKLKLLLLFIAVFALVAPACADFSFREITLKFAQISDSHLSERASTSYKMLDKSELLLTDAINQINQTPNLDFIVFTGDMVDEPTVSYYQEFFKIITDSKYPILLAYGNHDFKSKNVSNSNSEYLTKDEVFELIKQCNPNYPFDKSYWAFSPKKNFRIITLDLTADDGSSNGKIDEVQLAFLDNEIKTHPKDTILIFQHFPVVEPFPADHHKVLNAMDYVNVIQKYKNPILIFSGHYHTTKIFRDENIVHISTPSLVTYPNAFRTVNITDFRDRIEVAFQFHETTHKEIQAQSKANTISASLFAGIDKYKEPTIVIYKKYKEKKVKKQKDKAVKEKI